MPTDPKPQSLRDDDELPPLPALDDDGETFGADADGEPMLPLDRASDVVGLDDATAENDPLEAWGATIPHDAEDNLLDDSEADQTIGDDDDDLLAGAEAGLLEGSDEGDGRDVTTDEAGLFDEDAPAKADDGGAEGTGEDPALELRDDTESTVGTRPESDEEGFDDAAFEDEGAARTRASYEREPWPLRADVAWLVELVEIIDEWEPVIDRTRSGDVVATATHEGPLMISFDGGESFVRVPGCAAVSAHVVVPGTPADRAVVAALYDATRESSAIVVVRQVDGAPHAELVADLLPTTHEDDGELARVERLRARIREGGALEVLASGPFGHRLIRSRG